MFEHFLITRFNIPYSDWTRDRSGSITLDEKWLQQRFALFDRYCFPSVYGQTNQNFKWLVFFDVNTPLDFRKKIDQYQDDYKNFIPCYVAEMGNFWDELNVTIGNNLSNSSRKLITSRVDNDDALHRMYIDNIQKKAKTDREGVLNYKFGYVYDSKSKIVYFTSHESNQFITRFENIDGSRFKTVMGFDHTQASSNASVEQIEKIGWMIVVHEKNLSNQASGRPLFSPQKIFSDFNIEISNEKFSMDYGEMFRHLLRSIKRKLSKTMPLFS